MAKKNFLLLSLDDEKAKKVANVVSNNKCKKILDYLATKDHASETQVSKALNLPISTVHYNLQLLIEAGLVNVEEFHYSEKGKEVNHYRLANKYIIIAPEKTESLKQKLKKIFPVAIITIGIAGIIQVYSSFVGRSAVFANTLSEAAPKAVEFAEEAAVTGAQDMATAAAPEIMRAPTALPPNIALWFLVGAMCAVIIFFILSLENRRPRK